LYFSFAILGIALFGNTNFDPNIDDFFNPHFNTTQQTQYSNGINPFTNFRTLWPAISTLFRVSTGENWHFIMADCAQDNEYKSPLVATLYFFLFVILCQYITLNLFVAVLLENFNLVKSETKEQTLMKDEMSKFVEIWAVYDPDATNFINVNQLPFIVTSLNRPLGVGKKASQKTIENLLWECDIPIYRFIEKNPEGETIKRNRVYYKDVLYRLCKHGFGTIQADAMEDQDDAPKNPALELLRKERLIFSTKEYLAVSRICRAIKIKQGTSLGDTFLDVIMTAAKKKERELENQALGETFSRPSAAGKRVGLLHRLIHHLAHGSSDHG